MRQVPNLTIRFFAVIVGRSLFSCLALVGCQTGLSAETLKAHYGMTLMGLSIGSAYANGFVEPRSYRIDIGMRTTGLANLVNSAKGVASASGGMSLNGPSPSSYANTTSNSEETRTIRMSLSKIGRAHV
mgnify:FL=1